MQGDRAVAPVGRFERMRIVSRLAVGSAPELEKAALADRCREFGADRVGGQMQRNRAVAPVGRFERVRIVSRHTVVSAPELEKAALADGF